MSSYFSIYYVQLLCLLVFVYSTFTPTITGLLSFLVGLLCILINPPWPNKAKPTKQINPLRKSATSLETNEISREKLFQINSSIADFCCYNAEVSESVSNFKCIQMNSECIFAKKAKIWGSAKWNEEKSIEENVFRSMPTLLKFCLLCPEIGIDGFVFEIPYELSSSIEIFGSTIYSVLKTISDLDPAMVRCMNKSYLGKRGWVFEFNNMTFFITSFASFYPECNSRYSFGSKNGFILFQPDLSFAQKDLVPFTVNTNWENPTNVRDKIRIAFKNAGRGYLVQDIPLTHDILKAPYDGQPVPEWWNGLDKNHKNVLT